MRKQSYSWQLKENIEYPWVWYSAFNAEECKKIIELGNLLEQYNGKYDVFDVLNKNYRNATVSWFPVTENYSWIFDRCASVVNWANDNYFNYDLMYIESLQFTKYSKTEYHLKHNDVEYSHGREPRKLTFSIQLSDIESYQGGSLLLHYGNEPVEAKKEQGVCTLFPSYTLHEVEPVLSGIRYSLVGWVIGPKFK